VMDPEEGVMDVSETVKQSGGYDPWAQEQETQDVKEGLDAVKKRTVKVT
jgi:hypothetical protein